MKIPQIYNKNGLDKLTDTWNTIYDLEDIHDDRVLYDVAIHMLEDLGKPINEKNINTVMDLIKSKFTSKK